MSSAGRVTTEDNKATALAHVIHRGWCDLAESCSYGVDDLTEAERILSALAAEGYSVVKTEWEYGALSAASGFVSNYGEDRASAEASAADPSTRYGPRSFVRRVAAGLWEPVPEGSANG
jgi:hypothetical protein